MVSARLVLELPEHWSPSTVQILRDRLVAYELPSDVVVTVEEDASKNVLALLAQVVESQRQVIEKLALIEEMVE